MKKIRNEDKIKLFLVFNERLILQSIYQSRQVTKRVMIYDINNQNWTEGPSLNIKRTDPACMVDQKTETIHVIGGGNYLNSTEILKKGSKKWEMGPYLEQPVIYSAAVSSWSIEYVGYLVGGETYRKGRKLAKTWGLRRSDMEWIEMPKQLKIPRTSHSVVNVESCEIGC